MSCAAILTIVELGGIVSEKTIFDQLEKEHDKVKDLLSKAEDCSVAERKNILEKIEEELVPHARGEEKTLYAIVLQKAKDSDAEKTVNLTNEAYEEHHAVDQLVKDIKSYDVNGEKWLGMLKVLKENLEHHIKEEENDLFPKAKKLLSNAEQVEILEAYKESKENFKENMPTQGQISERSPSADLKNL